MSTLMSLWQRLREWLPITPRGLRFRLGSLQQRVHEIEEQTRSLERVQEALGRIEARLAAERPTDDLHASEFRVWSQWGEDGIIQNLVRRVPVPNTRFVEFGVEDYTEANTRFLLQNNNWTGLVMDGSEDNVRAIHRSKASRWHGLQAAHAFVTRENIDRLLVEHGFAGEIGLLSIDIDGNDYWVWEAIQSTRPAIVVVEYNYRFGKERAVTIPYDPAFVRSRQGTAMIYFGASLRALCLLGQKKGYCFVGCNSHGVNAFFVRRDLMPPGLKELTCEEGYVRGRFNEVSDAEGLPVRMTEAEEQAVLASFPLVTIA